MENTIQDNKTIELKIEQTKLCSLYNNELNTPTVTDITVTIEEWNHDDPNSDKEIGRISMSLINMTMAINKGYDLKEQCLEHSDYLGSLVNTFYSDYDFSTKITNVLDTPMNSDMLAITDISLHTEYHNMNIIEDALKMVIDQYSYVGMVGFKDNEFEYQSNYESIGFKRIKTKVGHVYGLNNEMVNN